MQEPHHPDKDAEMAEEKAKKGMGKLPIIIAVVVVVAAGGFFAMQSGKEEKETGIKLGKYTEDVGDFLVNLGDGSTYLSTMITVQTAEGTSIGKDDGKGKAKPNPAVSDAVISVLTSKTLDEISTPSGKARLKRELAYYMNHAYHSTYVGEDKGGKKKSSSDPSDDKEPKELRADYEPDYPEWDNDHGPVLKVYFTTFTTQR
jgi:flagellar FliL protein